jgi:signal transduction histidine kinase
VKSLLLTARIALFFALVTGLLLGATFWLFFHVAGHQMLDELLLLRAHQGVALAEELEPLLAAAHSGRAPLARSAIDDPAVRARVHSIAKALGLELRLEPPGPGGQARLPRSHGFYGNRQALIAGRHCLLVGAPFLESWVPVSLDGTSATSPPAAWLVVRGTLPLAATHRAFLRGLLAIGAVAFLAVLAISVYLTAPLRATSRSLDRIAAGDLDHRVVERGSGEVAGIGRSFNAMAERIRELLQGQKELMAGVSHELRSPLARMKVELELLRGRGEPAANTEAARIDEIEGEIDALDAMVEELLLISRFDLGAVPLEPEAIDLGTAAEQAWQRATGAGASASTSAAAGRGERMRLEFELPGEARQVAADRRLLDRLLGNLFSNAVRYAAEGTVRLSTQRSGERVVIRIADQGPGVEPDQLGRLFEPFYRADSSRSRKTGATGLGLMVVRRAVEAHGGSVRALAVAPSGLAIELDLPAAG